MMLETRTKSVEFFRGKQADDLVGWQNATPFFLNDLCFRSCVWRNCLEKIKSRHVAIFTEDTFEFIALFCACLQEEKVVHLPSNALPSTCQELQKDVGLFLGDFPDQFSPVKPGKTRIVHSMDSCILDVPENAEIIIYTSGSTGKSQAIPKRLKQFLIEAEILENLFGTICGKANVISTVSHQHIYGLLFKVFWPLMTGRKIHASSLGFPEELIAVTNNQNTILLSSPAHLKRFTESQAWKKTNHRISTVFSSGGPLERDVALAYKSLLGKAPIEIYGSSETGGIGWRQRDETTDESWTPFPGVKWRVNEKKGILMVRSSHLYDEDWFQTVDRVSPVGKDRFILEGRADRVVKIEEKRVSLSAIENALNRFPLVASSRVIMVEMEEEKRQRLAAFVILSDAGKKMLSAEGKLYLNRHFRYLLTPLFERVALPKIWRYLDELPVNMQGKTTYADLKAALASEESLSGKGNKEKLLFPEVILVEEGERKIKLSLRMPENLLFFQGHFHDMPILPGVVQIDFAIELGRKYFVLPPCFSHIQALKFNHIISPGDWVTLELGHDVGNSVLSFRYFSQRGIHASGKIIFKQTGNHSQVVKEI